MIHLDKGFPLTSDAAWQNYGISKLATRISELIHSGEKILKCWVTVKNRYGEDVRVVQYRKAKTK
jgi:hypothetical protein